MLRGMGKVARGILALLLVLAILVIHRSKGDLANIYIESLKALSRSK